MEWIKRALPIRRNGKQGRWRGFTLVELMIAIAIVGILVAVAIPQFIGYREKVRIGIAIRDIRTIEREIVMFYQEAEPEAFPDTLADIGRLEFRDPWGNPYRYLKIAGAEKKGNPGGEKARKDRFLVPLNSDFDLYSMGKDGDSRPPLTAEMSRDDVVRASDGAFVGLATDF